MNIVYNEGLIRKIVRGVLAYLITVDMEATPKEAHVAMQLTGLGSAVVLLARRMGLSKSMLMLALGSEWDQMDKWESEGHRVDISEIKKDGKSNAN